MHRAMLVLIPVIMVAAAGVTFLLVQGREDNRAVSGRVPVEVGGREAVDLVEQLLENGELLQSWVDDQHVYALFTDGEQVAYPLYDEEMYVAIAPFIDVTHPCAVHYLSSCRGELAHIDVEVRVLDENDRVLHDGRVTTGANGFFELWLPRDGVFTLSMMAEGKRVSGLLSTQPGSATCVTDMQLTDGEGSDV